MNENIKELLSKYPFLELHNSFSGEPINDNEEDRLAYNYWTYWDDTGWEQIWKKFLIELFKIYDTWDNERKKAFYIFDTKEKYGTLRVDISGGNEETRELENILEMLSRWTCIKCGKQPRDSRGTRIIWETKGWICPYCKKCILKETNLTRKSIKKYKIKNEGFKLKFWNKNGEFLYNYKDNGDWLVLDKISKISEG